MNFCIRPITLGAPGGGGQGAGTLGIFGWGCAACEYGLVYLRLLTLLWNQARMLVYIVSIRIIAYRYV